MKTQNQTRLSCDDQQHYNEKHDDTLGTADADKKSQIPSRIARLQDTWVLEGIAASLSTACFIAIAGILLAYKDKENPSLVGGLSLNAIISTLATACKAFLVLAVATSISQLKWIWLRRERPSRLSSIQAFDDASRGPLGSITILLRREGRSMVALGACTLVFLLAFEPFIQHVLSFPERKTDQHGDPRAKIHRVTDLYELDDLWEKLDYIVRRGIWSNSSSVKIPVSCPSGNCSWHNYVSLGYCSQCADVTSMATLHCELPPFESNSAIEKVSPCNVVLPHGDPSNTSLSINLENGNIKNLTIPADIIWPVRWDMRGSAHDGQTFAGVKDPFVVYAHAILTADNDTITTFPDNPLRAVAIESVTECAMSYCTREYAISVQNGQPLVNMTLVDFGERAFHDKVGNECWIPKSSNHSADISLDRITTKLEKEALLNATELARCGAVSMPWRSVNLSGEKRKYYRSADDDPEFYDYGWDARTFLKEGSDNYRGLHDQDFETVMANIAASLTQWILDEVYDQLDGTVYAMKVFVEVRWKWLILPALLVLLGDIFLVLTILASKKAKMAPWKSSVLATVYHGLDTVESDPDGYGTSSRMKKLGSATVVRLEDSESRLILKRAG